MRRRSRNVANREPILASFCLIELLDTGNKRLHLGAKLSPHDIANRPYRCVGEIRRRDNANFDNGSLILNELRLSDSGDVNNVCVEKGNAEYGRPIRSVQEIRSPSRDSGKSS